MSVPDEIVHGVETPSDMDGYGNINHKAPWWAIPVLSFFLTLLLLVLAWLGSTVMDLKTSVASMSTDMHNLDSNVAYLVTRAETHNGP